MSHPDRGGRGDEPFDWVNDLLLQIVQGLIGLVFGGIGGVLGFVRGVGGRLFHFGAHFLGFVGGLGGRVVHRLFGRFHRCGGTV